MTKRSRESLKRLGSSFKRLSWYDLGYFAATAYLASTLLERANWIQGSAFAVALYFSGQTLYRTHYRKDPQKLEDYCRRSAKQYNAKEYTKAKELASRGIDIGSGLKGDENLATAYILRAQAGIMLSNYEEAIQDCTSAITLDETLGTPYYFRGIAKELSGVALSECVSDLRKAGELGNEEAAKKATSIEKQGLRWWSNYVLETVFNMDKESEAFKDWGYTDADDEDSELWHKKFLDVAALAFAEIREQTDEEMSKTPLAEVYSDFVIWVIDLKCVDSLQSLRRLAPRLDIDMYDSLVTRLAKTSNLNERWAGFYNTRFADIYDKRGMGLKVLEEGR